MKHLLDFQNIQKKEMENLIEEILKVDLYKFLCLNFFSKVLPAPEYPDFASIIIFLVYIIFF